MHGPDDPQTHDLFKCKRCKGGKQIARAPAMLYGDTSTCVPLSFSLLSSWTLPLCTS